MKTLKENIFLDTNVIVNEFIFRNGDTKQKKIFRDAVTANEAIRWLESKNHILFVASFSIVQLVSMFQGKRAKIKFPVSKLQAGMRHIMSKYHIVSLDETDMEICAQEINGIDEIDIEDNLICRLSDKANCHHIMTFDKNDFNIHVNKFIIRPHKVKTFVKLNF